MVFLVAGVIMGTVTVASAITLCFSNLEDSKIAFNGSTDTFSFTHATDSHDFKITAEDPTGGGTIGFVGDITGTFNIGTIKTDGSLQTAAVTGSGTFSIIDNANPGQMFTASIDWKTIYTYKTSGGLNDDGVINLSNLPTPISYDGTNSYLLALKNNGGTAVGGFSFIPAKSLTQLTQNGANNSTSYSGTLSFVPLPSSLLLIGSGLVGLGLLRFRRKNRA